MIIQRKNSSRNNLNDQNVQNREPQSKLTTPTMKINKIKIPGKLLYIEKNIDCTVQLT